MEMMNVINWVMTLVWVALVIWVYADGKKNGVEKAGKWALTMLWNPFAVKKYMKIRMEQA